MNQGQRMLAIVFGIYYTIAIGVQGREFYASVR